MGRGPTAAKAQLESDVNNYHLMVTHVELGEEKSLFGHDTFFLDLVNVGYAVERSLERVRGGGDIEVFLIVLY